MDDKTMLELAARACSLTLDKSHSNGGPSKNDGFDCNGNAMLDWHNGYVWNPLTHDGDALRLAVKLRLDIEFLRGGDFVKVSTYYGDVSAEVEHTGDPAADTRRAIVRAAAEIGKGMGVG